MAVKCLLYEPQNPGKARRDSTCLEPLWGIGEGNLELALGLPEQPTQGEILSPKITWRVVNSENRHLPLAHYTMCTTYAWKFISEVQGVRSNSSNSSSHKLKPCLQAARILGGLRVTDWLRRERSALQSRHWLPLAPNTCWRNGEPSRVLNILWLYDFLMP